MQNLGRMIKIMKREQVELKKEFEEEKFRMIRTYDLPEPQKIKKRISIKRSEKLVKMVVNRSQHQTPVKSRSRNNKTSTPYHDRN